MYQEFEALLLSVAGITVPLNNLKLIYRAIRFNPPDESEEAGFNTAIAGKTCTGSCNEHCKEYDNGTPQMDCCKAFRKGYAIGALLIGQRPGWVVYVYKAGESTPHMTELWINSARAYASKQAWDKQSGNSAQFDSLRHKQTVR